MKQVGRTAQETDRILAKRNFWLGLITEDDPRSSRRLITLAVSVIFILTSIAVLVLMITTYVPTGNLNNINIQALGIQTELLKQLLYYQFMLIISGLALITAPNFMKVLSGSIGSMLTKRTKTEVDGEQTVITEEEFEIEEEEVGPPIKKGIKKTTKRTE